MGVRARVSRCSLQRRPRRDGEEAHLVVEWLRAPLVGSNWLYELSAAVRQAHRANWTPRARSATHRPQTRQLAKMAHTERSDKLRLGSSDRMNEITRKPAHTVTELASARQHQKTGRPSWSARWRVPLSSGPLTRADPSRVRFLRRGEGADSGWSNACQVPCPREARGEKGNPAVSRHIEPTAR